MIDFQVHYGSSVVQICTMELQRKKFDGSARFPRCARALHTFMVIALSFRFPFVCCILPLPTSLFNFNISFRY